MYHGSIARTQLDSFDPAIFFEWDWYIEVLHGEFAFGRDLEVHRHRDYQVGLARAPTFCELRQGWQVRIVTLWRTGINPGHDRFDLSLRQSPVVAELQRRIG